ncbi:zinc finger CCCH domain-containing protein 3-like isoform X2 [Penaeus japonicus]|nr:zinc finger CCCH domain-containing protein 3-like isoform X2 [Penaeus japonicus]XP_042856757.1 zinc finger CCCH domain-containing protein 3-like isoform X2 [Penaeus japonicus]
MVMDPPDEQKNIHVNPDFLPNKNKAPNGTRVHVNPAFFQKSRPVPSENLISQNQSLHPRHNYYPSHASSIPRVDPAHYRQQQVASKYPTIVSTSRAQYPATKLLATGAQTQYKYEGNKSMATNPNLSSIKSDVAANSSKSTGGKSLHLLTARHENQRHNVGNFAIQKKIISNPMYKGLYPSQPVNINRKVSPYSWTASKGLVTSPKKVLNHSVYKVNQTSNLQQNASQTLCSSYSNVNRIFTKSGNKVPEMNTQLSQESGKSQLGATSAKSSNILVNPKLIQSIASTCNPVGNLQTMKLTRLYPEQQTKSEQAASQPVVAKKSLLKNLKETPKKVSRFKVISKTKLVRRRSSSMSSEKGRIGVIKKSVSTVAQPLLKFPAQARKYSTSSGLKKRYLVKSRTKLVRQLSGSSNLSKDASSGNPKYTLKTKTKLVRRKSSSSSSNKTEEVENQATKSANSKTNAEKGKKFFVISKTKLVRRRSNSGVFKANVMVRNATAKPIKCWSSKFCGLSQVRNVNNVYKVVNNSIRLSLKQKAAKGIISKYKINRLKSDFSQRGKSNGEKALLRHGNSVYRVNNYIGMYQKQKGMKGHISKYKVNHLKLDSHGFKTAAGYPAFKKGKLGIRSDRIINIGGILYKSTKTSLRKQLAKKSESENKTTDSMCVVHLRGDKFQVGAGGRTLKRVTDTARSGGTQPALSRVHIGGLTYSRTANGQYELTKVHQTRAVVSSAKQRSMLMLSQRRKRGAMQKRNEYCVFFNRFGRCSKKDQGECPYIHDPKRIAVCTRFLRGRCPVSNCPFSHVIDPDKMPVCSHFVRASCTRDNCPYRHVRVNPNAPICPEFLQGHCTLGEECKNQHILVCEEYSLTGTCPRGVTCPLSHHKGRGKRKRSESGKPKRSRLTSISRKRKASESQDVLGGPKVKNKTNKKMKVKTGHVPLKRYFQFSSLESNDDDDSECQTSTLDLCVTGDQPCSSHPPEPSSLSSAPSDKDQEHIEEKQPVELSPSSFTCRMEETRLRLKTKMEKMKQTISKLELSEDGVLEDLMSERKSLTNSNNDSLHIQGNSSSSVAEKDKDKNSGRGENSICNQNGNDVDRGLQRPPLPKRLPSYIPLSMDDEN